MEVKTIGVIGAETTGCEIAYEAALAGYRTVLEDVMGEKLARAKDWTQQILDQAVKIGSVTPGAREETLARMEFASSVEEVCRKADFLIEAVPEEMELKLELFTLFDKFAKPHAVMASTASSLSIAEMAEMTCRPELCVGMQFFHPAPKSTIIQIVPAPKTSAETITICHEIGRRMGKEVVAVGEPLAAGLEWPGRLCRESGRGV
jgi:3-hydroxybutyryl-CoA dehydrogenase